MIILELTRVCRSSGREEGKVLLTGDTFSVSASCHKWGKFERDICIVDNGTHNNGGYWVAESYGNIVSVIEEQTGRCG
jgi:hypothetical protein